MKLQRIFYIIFGFSLLALLLYWFLIASVIKVSIDTWRSNNMSQRLEYAIDKNLPLPPKK